MKNVWIITAVLLLTACQISNDILYQNSITNAMSPEESKVYDDLVAINESNDQLIRKQIDGEEYILVVTWKQDVKYYQPYVDSGFYNTGNYPIWVTTAPELYNRMQKEKYKDQDMRLKQLLGLPPNATYNYFVQFWVKTTDLFRPCPDNEISDEECSLCFPTSADSNYIAWVNDNRISRYYACDLYSKYPWTQLGYTYDWSARNKSHVGLSEFVIGDNKNIIVEGIYKTSDYLNEETNINVTP